MIQLNLSGLLLWLITYKYLVIFITTIFEGPIVMMFSGILLKLGSVTFIPVYLTLMAGDLVGDTFWYCIGYYFAGPITNKYGYYFSLTPEILDKTKRTFEKNPIKILFISKITMGLGFALAILVAAGMSKISFKKYIIINASGQFIWTGVLLYMGYTFGNLYQKINNDLKMVSLVGFIIIVFILLRGFAAYMNKRNRDKMV